MAGLAALRRRAPAGRWVASQAASPWNAVWADDALAGFVDWETASPSRREDDLAFSALTWVPLLTAEIAGHAGFGDAADRHRRFHLLLDAYGYTGGRTTIRDAIIGRVERNVAVIRRFADGGEPTFQRMLPWAADLERSGDEVAELPDEFWQGQAADGVNRLLRMRADYAVWRGAGRGHAALPVPCQDLDFCRIRLAISQRTSLTAARHRFGPPVPSRTDHLVIADDLGGGSGSLGRPLLPAQS